MHSESLVQSWACAEALAAGVGLLAGSLTGVVSRAQASKSAQSRLRRGTKLSIGSHVRLRERSRAFDRRLCFRKDS